MLQGITARHHDRLASYTVSRDARWTPSRGTLRKLALRAGEPVTACPSLSKSERASIIEKAGLNHTRAFLNPVRVTVVLMGSRYSRCAWW